MASFLICAPQETEWRVDNDRFETLLRSRWPEVTVRHHDDPGRTYPVDADVTQDGATFTVMLERDGSTLSIEGTAEQAAAVAHWWRRQAPADQELAFFDQGYSAQVDLTDDMSVAQIAAPFTGA